MKPKFRLASSFAALQLLAPAVLSAQTINTSWNGATSSDWATPTNWSGGSVPAGVVAAVNTTTGNLATVSTVVTQQPSWLVVANSAAGTMNMLGGSLTVNGEFDVGNGNGGTGIFNMSGGSLTVNSWIVIGRLNGTANGTVNLTGGTLTKTGGGNFNMGEGTIKSTVSVSNATLNLSSGELWVGQTGLAELNLGAGGAITVNNWAVIGRANGTGVFNITGGTFTKQGAGTHFVIGNGSGTVNQSGGTFTTSGAELRIAEAGSGLFNLTGGTATVGIARVGNLSTGTAELRISGTGAMTASEVNIGNTGSVSGTVNLSGGTLTTNSVTAGTSSGTKTFNFNGGTLKPGASSTGFYNNSAAIRTNVRDGGAKIDTAGYDITIAEALEHSNIGGDLAIDGGLTKNGNGTLSLTGINTHTGDTTINAGSIAIGTGGSIANSSAVILNGGNFNVSAVSGFAMGATQSLKGSGGSVTGDIIVNGTLTIGASPGTMTFNDDLTLGSGSISNFEFTTGTLTLGSYDLALGGTGSQQVGFGGTLNLFFNSGETYANGSSVKIFDFETYTDNFTTFNYDGLGAGQSATFDSLTGTVSVIPEPSAALLGGLGILVLMRRRRIHPSN